jgi:transposase
MLSLTPQMQILIGIEPIDFRKGIDGISALCRNHLNQDPYSGKMFVFINKKKTAIKIFVFDGQGSWLCQKRLSRSYFRWWPRTAIGKTITMDVPSLQMLLWNGNPSSNSISYWKRLTN